MFVDGVFSVWAKEEAIGRRVGYPVYARSSFRVVLAQSVYSLRASARWFRPDRRQQGPQASVEWLWLWAPAGLLNVLWICTSLVVFLASPWYLLVAMQARRRAGAQPAVHGINRRP